MKENVMKTGSKKQYRKHRAYVMRDARLLPEADRRLEQLRYEYRMRVKLLRQASVNHLDPLLKTYEDEAVRNAVAVDAAEHEVMEAEKDLEASILFYEAACEEAGIDPETDRLLADSA